MATLLDAYLVLALLLDEPLAAEVASVLLEGDAGILAVNLTEVLEVAQRRRGLDEAELQRALTPLAAALVVLPVQEKHAWRAAAIRSRYYDRRARPLSLADCLLLAAAEEGDRIATSDPAVAGVARAEGIELVPLPDTTGTRP